MGAIAGLSVLGMHFFVAAFGAHAQILPSCTATGDCGVNDFLELAFNIVKFLWGFAGSIALLMFVVGGLTLLMASGDPGRVKSGMTTLQNATIGLLLVLGSWVIINTILLIATGQDLATVGPAKLFGTTPWNQP